MGVPAEGSGRFDEGPVVPEGRWFDAGPHLADYGETAALFANLDVLVSVDTGVVQLAGVLGAPTLLRLSYQGEWRWMDDRVDAPWYRGHRFLRQARPGAWEGVVERAGASAIPGFRSVRGDA